MHEAFIGSSTRKIFHVTEAAINSFAEVSGDRNPVHLDASYAATTVFKRKIAHGMYVGSLISAVLAGELPGPGTIYLSQTINFRKPIYVGETVEVCVTVNKEIKPNIFELTTNCFDCNGAIALEGIAVVKYVC